MIKYIILAVILFGIAGRLLLNAKNKSSVILQAKKLASGRLTLNDLKEKFDILLFSFTGNSTGLIQNLLSIKKGLHMVNSAAYHIHEIKDDTDAAIIIASVAGKRDTLYASDDMKITLPVSLFIVKEPQTHTVKYYCECPEDNDHEKLVRDFITYIHTKVVVSA